MLLAVSLYLLLSLSLPYSLRIFQWNAGGLQARSTKLLYFISSHPVDLIYIQESNLNLSSSFQIPGFSALRSHGTHSRSGILSTDVADASRGIIIFVKQGLSFSELSTSSLSWLGPYSDYIEVNISLNNFSSLSFFNVYASPIRSSTKNSRTIFFSLHSSLLCGSGSGGFFALPLPLSQKKDRFRFHIPALDFCIWSILAKETCVTAHTNTGALKKSFKQEWAKIPQQTFCATVKSFRKRLECLIEVKSWSLFKH